MKRLKRGKQMNSASGARKSKENGQEKHSLRRHLCALLLPIVRSKITGKNSECNQKNQQQKKDKYLGLNQKLLHIGSLFERLVCCVGHTRG